MAYEILSLGPNGPVCHEPEQVLLENSMLMVEAMIMWVEGRQAM